MNRLFVFFAAALVASAASGTTAKSQLTITVKVAPAERCTSQTLEQPSASVVQVVCRSGNFVTIVPAPGNFVGPQSSAYRYYIRNDRVMGQFLPTGVQEFQDEEAGVGTVTGLRLVSGSSAADNLFELLISF